MTTFRTVVVLGGTSDIARAMIRRLGPSGTRTVVLAGRDGDRLDEAAAEARQHGATATATVLFDARDPERAAAAVSEAFAAANGPVDLVIVAVGLLGDQGEKEEDPHLAAEMVTVNVTWPVAALTEVRRLLLAQGSGHILVMSSAAAVRVRRSTYLYSGAKIGLDRTCLGMIDSLRGTGVRLQLLRPGVVRTKMTTGRPELPFTTDVDVAAANAVAGLSTAAPVIWSPPVLRYLFAVLRHLPGPLWRAVADR